MINTKSAKEARLSAQNLQRLFDQIDRKLFHATNKIRPGASIEEQKQCMRSGIGRNKIMFLMSDINAAINVEILRQDGGGSVITRSVLKMVDQAVTAGEILEKSTAVVENQLVKFNAVADKAIAESKKRVAQITDYNNRLGVALNNLNKTLGDERMLRALENADKLSTALELLDQLEKNGSLHKIMAAIRA
jgi:uncharacterized protein with GYD domain